MFVLFVDMRVKPGSQPALEKTYNDVFRPAIARQEGFRDVELLRPNQEGANGAYASLSSRMLCRRSGWPLIFIRKCGRKWKTILRIIPLTTTPRFKEPYGAQRS